jgi:hypothetical protein
MKYPRFIAYTLIAAGPLVWWGCKSPATPASSSASLAISSATVDFGRVNVGSVKDTSVLFTNTGVDTLLITSQSFSSPLFKLADSTQSTLKIAPGSYLSDTIQFDPKDTSSVVAYDTIRSNAATMVITLHGGGIALTRIITIPASINFGNTRLGLCGDSLLGAPRDTIVSFQNSGNDTLRVHSLMPQSPLFSVVSYDSVVAPAGSGSIHVRFCPMQTGIASAALIVSSNATVDSSLTITLSGNGLPYAPGVGSVYTYMAQQLDTAGKPIGNPYQVMTNIIATGITYQGKSNVSETSDSNYFEVESDGDVNFYAPGFQTYPAGTVAGSGWLTLPFASQNPNLPLLSDDTTYLDSAGTSISVSVRDTASYKGMTTITVGSNPFPTSHVHLIEDAVYTLPKEKIYIVAVLDFFFSQDLGYLATRVVVINKLVTMNTTRKLTNLNGERRVLTSFNLR